MSNSSEQTPVHPAAAYTIAAATEEARLAAKGVPRTSSGGKESRTTTLADRG